MALSVTQTKRLNAVRIISKKDPSIDWDQTSEEDWKTYCEDPTKNEALIKLKPDQAPTIFLCNFELSGRERATGKDSMVKGIDDEKNVQVSYGYWSYTIVRMILKEIQNPPGTKDGIVLKKDPKGYVDDYTMSILDRPNLGLVAEIFNHYMTLSEEDETKAESKN